MFVPEVSTTTIPKLLVTYQKRVLTPVVRPRHRKVEKIRPAAGVVLHGTQIVNAVVNGLNRNALCPCGSGKKFKRCHAKREDGTRKERAYYQNVPVVGIPEAAPMPNSQS
jgi:hypothetical protein